MVTAPVQARRPGWGGVGCPDLGALHRLLVVVGLGVRSGLAFALADVNEARAHRAEPIGRLEVFPAEGPHRGRHPVLLCVLELLVHRVGLGLGLGKDGVDVDLLRVA